MSLDLKGVKEMKTLNVDKHRKCKTLSYLFTKAICGNVFMHSAVPIIKLALLFSRY